MTSATRAGVLAGLVGGAISTAALALGLVTGGLPVVAQALWERQLRVIPMELFAFLIVRLKFAAKPAAYWGMLVLLVLLWAAVGGLLARLVRGAAARGLAAWAVAAILLGALAWQPASVLLAERLAAQGGAGGGGLVAAAIAVYALLFAAPYAVLAHLLHRPSGGPGGRGAAVTRREVLTRSALLVAAAIAGTAAARWMQVAMQQAVATAQSALAKVRGLPPEITPNDQFYIVSKNPPGFDPVVDAARWSLQVGGLVGRPIRLTYDEIRAMPAADQFQTLECISNEVGGDLISNARWRGVRLRDVLLRAGGPSPKAVKVVFRCADGYTESLPVGDAMHPSTLLAYEMNGEPLPPAHGFPLRLLVPGLFGLKNPKWITRIEVVDFDFQGYWQASGWSDEGVVKTTSKFTALPSGARVGEEVGLGGVAYAGDRGIKDVEVSTDDGKTWQKADVKPALGPFTWVLWAAVWKPTAPGQYTLKVRARDGTGALQIARPAPPLPDGATGYHTVRVRMR